MTCVDGPADSDSVNLGSNPSSPARVKPLQIKCFVEIGRLCTGLFHVAHVAVCSRCFPAISGHFQKFTATPSDMNATWQRSGAAEVVGTGYRLCWHATVFRPLKIFGCSRTHKLISQHKADIG